MTRTCRHCGHVGEVGPDFYPKFGNTCRECAKRRDTERRLRVQREGGPPHERRKEAMRIAQAKRLYGLTADEARTLYAKTICEICGETVSNGRRINIDHDHVTGRVRGVLCLRCNRGIGFFLDRPELLLNAAAYLTRSSICSD